ncbi:AraC family transcriptional regulator [Salipiger bermudensis]|uniref:Transcriptional regulator, AraC family protein n=1 Tax=Salipiger bermudensis (strain DSM 26914 / JCM 13377 / KCTC 12554 / HTCC2601) TaxID=314265 RepID=Q0FT65_SALBH|nr:helix-turn-helix domain-containing protein [Salipiger bermudensis]EAU47304.1 transcriptional regulator, AraC family protein [Salipiger bermudensis HTCC2601]
MLDYAEKHWEEKVSLRGDFRATLFSAPERFTMSRGRDRHLKVASASFPAIGTSLIDVASSGHEIELADDNFLTIMLPTHGVTRVRMDRKEQIIEENSALGLGPSERWTQVDRLEHRDFRANLAKIDLQHARQTMMIRAFMDDPVVPIASEALAGFRGLMRYLFADLSSPAPTLVQKPASDLFAALVAEHLRHLLATGRSAPMADRAQAELVRQAVDYMAAFLTEPMTMPSIAEAVGVSTRRLQDAFRLITGQTPWQQLTALRLEKARARLLAGAGASVTTIALECGFSHLGRFSQAYRARFHELPSMTLSRAREGQSTLRPPSGSCPRSSDSPT